MLLGLFVAGVMAGTLIRLALPRLGQVVVLLLVAPLLGGVALLGGWAAPAMVLAMGAANATFERDGEVSIGVTYMTGTLVKIGQHLAHTVAGRERWAWLPYLLLWAGFLVGAGLGALAFPLWGWDRCSRPWQACWARRWRHGGFARRADASGSSLAAFWRTRLGFHERAI